MRLSLFCMSLFGMRERCLAQCPDACGRPRRASSRRDLRTERAVLQAVGSLGAGEDTDNEHRLPGVICRKKQTIRTPASPEDAFPFWTNERFHVALEGIGLHAVHYARNALLNGPWKRLKVLLGVFGEITRPPHALRPPMPSFFLL